MNVIWNGSKDHPGGRQLFVREETRRPAPVLSPVSHPRRFLPTPEEVRVELSAMTLIKSDHHMGGAR